MSRNVKLLQRAASNQSFDIPSLSALFEREPPKPPLSRKYRPDEEIGKLVQRLFLRAELGGPRIISFSGIAHDERSSCICVQAGHTLAAQVNASVCVIDANLASPRLHIHMGATNRIGLADALTTEGSIRTFALANGNLWLIPSGSGNVDLHTKLERYRSRFAELRKEFEYILVSAPPLARETEAISMGLFTDGVVLVVEANHSRREAVRQSKEQLERSGVKLLGAVLDQRTFPIPAFIYRRL